MGRGGARRWKEREGVGASEKGRGGARMGKERERERGKERGRAIDR